MRNLIVITGLVAALAGGTIAEASPGHGNGRSDDASDRGKERRQGKGGERRGSRDNREDRAERKESRRAERCAKPRRVGFVAKGTFVSGDADSVTLQVLKANRHARRSGIVTVGEEYTATPSDSSRIRYVNRDGAEDAQSTDRVKVVGKVTQLRRKCSSDDFTPTVSIRKVKVTGPDSDDEPETEASGS